MWVVCVWRLLIGLLVVCWFPVLRCGLFSCCLGVSIVNSVGYLYADVIIETWLLLLVWIG